LFEKLLLNNFKKS